MVRPFKMTILSSLYILLLGQGLLLLHSAHVTDLPISLPQVSANDCCNFRLEQLHHDSLSRGGGGHDHFLVSLVTSESTRGQLLL